MTVLKQWRHELHVTDATQGGSTYRHDVRGSTDTSIRIMFLDVGTHTAIGRVPRDRLPLLEVVELDLRQLGLGLPQFLL